MQLGSEGWQDYSSPDLVPLNTVQFHCQFLNVLTLMCVMTSEWVHSPHAASPHISPATSVETPSLLLLLLLLLLEVEVKVVCCSCSSRLQMVM